MMKYNVVTTKKLITDDGKIFRIGSEIAFILLNKEINNFDKYIGEITEITDTTITLNNIEVNRENIEGIKVIKLADIEPKSCNYIYYD